MKCAGTAALLTAVLLAGAGKANATPAYAYAELVFTNFSLTGATDIQSQSVTTGASANYPGQGPQSASGVGNITTGAPLITAITGPTPTTPGTFTPQYGGVTGSTAGAQAGLSSGLSGSQAQTSIVGPITGATSSEVSESNLTLGGSKSGGETDTNTGIDVIFTAMSTTVTLSFTASANLLAAVATSGDSASAKISASYELDDLNTSSQIDYKDPSQLNDAFTVTSTAFPRYYTLSGFTQTYTDSGLTIGDEYSIQINSTTEVQLSTAAAIPEPFSVALLGTGLTALGLIRHVRRAR